jgi:hypothetical protein
MRKVAPPAKDTKLVMGRKKDPYPRVLSVTSTYSISKCQRSQQKSTLARISSEITARENFKELKILNAVEYAKNVRLVSIEGSSHDIRDPLIISIFKSCLKDDTFSGDQRIFTMDYRIPSPRNLLGRDNVV